MFSQNIKVFKMPLLGFIFGDDRLILSLLPKYYSSFQNASLRTYIRRQSFNLISFCLKYIKVFKMPLSGFIFDGSHLILSLLP